MNFLTKMKIMNRKTILVTGGAGFIGSHVNQMLNQAGYNTIVLDNLTRGNKGAVRKGLFIEGSLSDEQLLLKIFTSQKIDAVMHFAAFIDVGESIVNPGKYYQNNVWQTLVLLEAMQKHQVQHFIFSSTAAIFGLPQEKTINENHPKLPINPYGQSKLMIETILSDFDLAHQIKSCSLRYFNAAGGDPDGEIKYSEKKESNLIPLILKSLKNGSGSITIYGTDYDTKDGTCIRDYIHVHDLALAHILSMEKLFNTRKSVQYNLGNGNGFSVRDVILAAEQVTGLKVNVKEGNRRAGDPPILVANSDKAQNELGWHPQYPKLEQMIEHAWKAML